MYSIAASSVTGSFVSKLNISRLNGKIIRQPTIETARPKFLLVLYAMVISNFLIMIVGWILKGKVNYEKKL